MKLFTIFSVVMLGITFAELVLKDVNTLVHRAQLLLNESHHLIEQHKTSAKTHLIGQLEQQTKDLQSTLGQLHDLVANATRRTLQLNNLEELLLTTTNRLNYELQFASEVYGVHNATDHNNELIQYGEKLIVQGKELIVKHQGHNENELVLVGGEIKEIEELIKKLKEHPNEAEHEKLTLHEKSLNVLIHKLEQLG